MTIITTDRIGVALSEPSKMRGTCKTWSLPALKTCPGSRNPDGGLVPACADCYATEGFYMMPAARELRDYNLSDWKRDDWVPEMITAIAKAASRTGKFRFFDSGDMYSLSLAQKIYEICRALPDVQFWIPTRQGKFDKFKPILRKLGALPNVVVRHSSDSTTGGRLQWKHSSTIIQSEKQAGNAHICPATIPGNKANCKAHNCTACWDKSVPVIAYHFH